MSRFLKFIVHLVVICAIIVALGLALPPFFGVTTVIVDDHNMKTNLPMGSVTYAIPTKLTELAGGNRLEAGSEYGGKVYQETDFASEEDHWKGDSILVQDGDATYRYKLVRFVDPENHVFTVADTQVPGGKELTVASNGEYAPRVFFTLGYVGYLQAATKSMEGLIILGLGILFLIILYVIAELWKKDGSREREYEAGGPAPKSRKELKREAKELARAQKEEEQYRAEQEKAQQKARKKAKSDKKKVRTGGFVDEIDEDDDDYEEEQPREQVTMQPAESEAHEFLKKEVAAATSDAPQDFDEAAEEEARIVEALREKEPEKEAPQESREPLIDESEIEEIRRRAIPGYKASELEAQAKAAGDSPEVVKDDITDVTLFDYSDILDEE